MHGFPIIPIFVVLNMILVNSEPDNLFLDSDVDGITYQSDFLEDAGPSSNLIGSTACATQRDFEDEWALLSRDDNSCGPPPLSSDTLQLFQDPLQSLEEILPPSEESSKATYPGLLTPEQQLEKAANPNPCEAYLLFGYIYHLCCLFARGDYPQYKSVHSCFVQPGMSLAPNLVSIARS